MVCTASHTACQVAAVQSGVSCSLGCIGARGNRVGSVGEPSSQVGPEPSRARASDFSPTTGHNDAQCGPRREASIVTFSEDLLGGPWGPPRYEFSS